MSRDIYRNIHSCYNVSINIVETLDFHTYLTVTGCPCFLLGWCQKISNIESGCSPPPSYINATSLLVNTGQLGKKLFFPSESNEAVPAIYFLWWGILRKSQLNKRFCLFCLGFSFVYFLSFRATPAAPGDSQARSRIVAVATGLCHRHSNPRSEPHLEPTPQLTAMLDP